MENNGVQQVSAEALSAMVARAGQNKLPTGLSTAQDHVTVNLQVHHTHPGDQPFSIEHFGANYYCQTLEQPYGRRKTATEKWEHLDLGWFTAEQVGLIIIQNQEGTEQQINPSEQELKAIQEHVLELKYETTLDNCTLRIAPGWAMPLCPSSAGALMIRCRKGTAAYRISVLPN